MNATRMLIGNATVDERHSWHSIMSLQRYSLTHTDIHYKKNNFHARWRLQIASARNEIPTARVHAHTTFPHRCSRWLFKSSSAPSLPPSPLWSVFAYIIDRFQNRLIAMRMMWHYFFISKDNAGTALGGTQHSIPHSKKFEILTSRIMCAVFLLSFCVCSCGAVCLAKQQITKNTQVRANKTHKMKNTKHTSTHSLAMRTSSPFACLRRGQLPVYVCVCVCVETKSFSMRLKGFHTYARRGMPCRLLHMHAGHHTSHIAFACIAQTTTATTTMQWISPYCFTYEFPVRVWVRNAESILLGRDKSAYTLLQ